MTLISYQLLHTAVLHLSAFTSGKVLFNHKLKLLQQSNIYYENTISNKTLSILTNQERRAFINFKNIGIKQKLYEWVAGRIRTSN